MLKRISLLVIFALVSMVGAVQPAQAANDEASVIQAVVAKSDPAEGVAVSKQRDSARFHEKVRLLQSSPAYMSLLRSAYDDPGPEVEKIAALSTLANAQSLVRNTAGKAFRVTKSASGEPEIKLVRSSGVPLKISNSDAAPNAARNLLGLNCWKAWVAFVAWQIGTGTICSALLFAFVVVGAVCHGVRITSSLLINWNRAC